MNQNSYWENHWRDYYAPSDKFAQLFSDHAKLKKLDTEIGLTHEEKKRLKVVKELIDGKLN